MNPSPRSPTLAVPVDDSARDQSQCLILDAVSFDKFHHAWVTSESKLGCTAGSEHMRVRGRVVVREYNYPVALDEKKCWHYNPTDGFQQRARDSNASVACL
jgi:hypothetical protein